MFTRSSVHWADRIVATRHSSAFENSSATCASGYAAESRSTICGARWSIGLVRVSFFGGIALPAGLVGGRNRTGGCQERSRGGGLAPASDGYGGAPDGP